MNGRVYDPVLGRFLSPDNFVQAPDFTQNFNRYAYCLNNPLIYTDPTGEWFGIDDAIVAGLGFVVGYVSYGISSGDWGWDAVVSGGIAAGASWLIYNTAGAASDLLVEACMSQGAATVIGNGVGGAVGTFAVNVAGQAYLLSRFRPSRAIRFIWVWVWNRLWFSRYFTYNGKTILYAPHSKVYATFHSRRVNREFF